MIFPGGGCMVKKLRWFLLLLACGLLGGCAPLRGTVTEVRNAQCGDFKVSIAQDEKPVREAGGKGLIGFRIQVTYTGEGDIQVWHSSPLCSVALYRGGEELLPAMRQNELCTSFFRKDEPLIFWYAVPREDEVVGALERGEYRLAADLLLYMDEACTQRVACQAEAGFLVE